MKKWIVTVLMLVGMISMVGCSDAPKTAEKMYIEPAQLTEEEEKIASLIPSSKRSKASAIRPSVSENACPPPPVSNFHSPSIKRYVFT